MQLKFDFSQDVRLLYLYTTACCLCGSNQMLEIHHILGRVSDSAFNSSVLCKECHAKICHNREEHQKIFNKSVVVLQEVGFKPNNNKDIEFLRDWWSELVNDDTYNWFIDKFSTGHTRQKVP